MARCEQSSKDYYEMAKKTQGECFFDKTRNEADCKEEIIKYCTAALDLNDDAIQGHRSYIYTMRGMAFLALKNFSKAADDCSVALDLNEYVALDTPSLIQQKYLSKSERYQSTITRLMAFYDLGFYDKVLKDCNQIIENTDDEEHLYQTYLMRSQVYFRLGDIEKSLEDLKISNTFDLVALMEEKTKILLNLTEQQKKDAQSDKEDL